MGLSRPDQLAPDDDLSHFRCGEDAVDYWLQRKARRNHRSGASKVFVVRDGNQIAGFYTLSASGIVRARIKGRFSRGMPDPVPVLLLGQLAVDQSYQRRGLGAALVRDALLRSLTAAETAGIVAVFVDAMTPALIPLYERFGFDSISASDPTAMMIRLKDVRAALVSSLR